MLSHNAGSIAPAAKLPRRSRTRFVENGSIISAVDSQTLKDYATDAIRYWEPRRLIYNAALAAIVLFYFFKYYPGSRSEITLNGAQGIFILAVLANVAYCAAYVADVFAQMSGYRDLWRKHRWLLLVIGVVFAGIIARVFALGFFQNRPDESPFLTLMLQLAPIL